MPKENGIAVVVSPQHTEAFRAALKQSSRNIVTMATIAAAVREESGHKALLEWLRLEFDVSAAFVARLLRVHTNLLVSVNLTLEAIEQIAPSALYLLAAPSFDEEVKGEIVERASSGEKITHAAVKNAVKVKATRREPPKPAPPITPAPEDVGDEDEPEATPEPTPPAKPAGPPWSDYNDALTDIAAAVESCARQTMELALFDKGGQAKNVFSNGVLVHGETVGVLREVKRALTECRIAEKRGGRYVPERESKMSASVASQRKAGAA